MPRPRDYAPASASTLYSMAQHGASVAAMRQATAHAVAYIDRLGLGDRLAQWFKAAPTVPAGALIALAQQNVDPGGPLGQWVISSAVPVLQSGKNRIGDQMSPQAQDAVYGLVANPSSLRQIQQLPLDLQTQVFKHSASRVGSQIQAGDPLVDTSFGNDVASAAILPESAVSVSPGVITRPVFTALQAGYEGVQAAFRHQLAEGDVANPTGASLRASAGHISGNNALAPLHQNYGQTLRTPFGKVEIGTPGEIYNPGQITAVQALKGKSLGGGLFPSPESEAGKAQAEAARRAAALNGHALTPGRYLASFVAKPDSTPYNIASGTIDFATALEADPAAQLLGKVGEAAKAARSFAPMTEDDIARVASHLVENFAPEHGPALREWAGTAQQYQGAIARGAAGGGDLHTAIVTKLTDNPAALSTLVDQGILDSRQALAAVNGGNAGIIRSLRDLVHPQTFMSWMNTNAGQRAVGELAKRDGLNIWLKSGRKIPVETAWELGGARTDAEVRDILARTAGREVTNIPAAGNPYTVEHPFSGLRLFQRMPNYSVDGLSPAQMVERGYSELALGKVPMAERDALLRPLAESTSMTESLKAYEKIGNRIGTEILNRDANYQKVKAAYEALPPELETAERSQLGAELTARENFVHDLVQYFPKRNALDKTWALDALGNKPIVEGLGIDGRAVQVEGPYTVNELLNRAIPAIGGDGIHGIRQIRQQVSWAEPFFRHAATRDAFNTATYMLDHLTQASKVFTLLKMALPVRFLADEQARMASAGVDSFFSHPISYLAWAIGKKGETDLAGAHWVDMLADDRKVYTEAVGRSLGFRGELGYTDRAFAKGWGEFTRGDRQFANKWGDRLSFLHTDPTTKAVVTSMRDGTDLNLVKDAFWNGDLASQREQLMLADLAWGSKNLASREQSDAYVESLVQRVLDHTDNGDARLVDELASGKAWRGGQTDQSLKRYLQQMANEGRGPARVVGSIPFTAEDKQLYRRTTNAFFSVLMDKPAQDFTRSPMFRQTYYENINKLLPYMTEQARTAALEQAQKIGIHLNVGTVAADANLTLEHADTLAKAQTLQRMHDVLYYPGQRILATDWLRNYMPFAEAWRNVLKSWSKLIVENPKLPRRIQQGVTGARQSGWWFANPADHNNEYFTLVPGAAMKHLPGGVGFPMVSPVKGLNILGEGLPGVGLAVEIPASVVANYLESDQAPPGLNHLTDTGAYAFLKRKLLPYGDPDLSGGLLETLFPGWFDKLRYAGYLGPLGRSPNEERIFQNAAKDAFQYKVATGNYDLSNPDELQRAIKDSVQAARYLYLWRGLTQFIAPSAPSYLKETPVKDGGVMMTYLLADEYRKATEANGGDSYKALLDMVGKYGENVVFSVMPQAVSINGVEATPMSRAWRDEHPGFADKYKNLYGFWVGQDGAFDYQEYLHQIKNGERIAPDLQQWAGMAQARLGNAWWSNVRSQVSVNPNEAESQWLNQQYAEIQKHFPSFGHGRYEIARDERVTQIQDLYRAIKDPAVRDTRLAKSIGVYLDLRDQAIAAQDKAGHEIRGDALSSSKQMQPLRDWLYENGTKLANEQPEFLRIWNELLSHEVQPKDENG